MVEACYAKNLRNTSAIYRQFLKQIQHIHCFIRYKIIQFTVFKRK